MNALSLPILILAAGRSSRMRGRDKLLEEVEGRPLIRRQAELGLSVTRGPVLMALPPPPHPRHAALAGLSLQIVPVPDADEGMNASLRAGFAALPAGCGAAMLLLGDLPELTASDLRQVAEAVDGEPENLIWRGATDNGEPGHPVVFAEALFPEFARLTGDGGGREVVRKAKGQIALVPLPGRRARRDLDTPEDWAAWRDAQRAGP